MSPLRRVHGVCGVVQLSPPVLRSGLRWLRGFGDDPVANQGVSTAAVLVGVMRPGCPFDSTWSLVCELCQLTVVWVDWWCFLPFVFLGEARRLGLPPYNT